MDWSEAFCAQRPPNFVASRTAVHGWFLAGAFQRSAPTGGCANGMPRKRRLMPATSPWIMPSSSVRSVPDWMAIGAGSESEVQAASAARTKPTATRTSLCPMAAS